MLIDAMKIQMIKKPDQQTYDFTVGDFTTSGEFEYHDLDLSVLIPAGAKMVTLWGAFKGDAADTEGSFAQYGHTGAYLKMTFFQPVANIGCAINCDIPVGPDRKIKYRFSDVNYSYINLSVVSWWI